MKYQDSQQHNLTKSNITIQWVPGHENIIGNKKADKEARLVTTHPNHTSPNKRLPLYLHGNQLSSSISALKRAQCESSKARWTRLWVMSPRFQLMKKYDMNTPSNSFMKLVAKLTKCQISLFVWLCTNHISLNKHLHRIWKSDTPYCPHCTTTIETVRHYILLCPHYSRERQQLCIALGRSALGCSTDDLTYLLTQKKATAPLLQFINATGRFHTTFDEAKAPKPSANSIHKNYTSPVYEGTVRPDGAKSKIERTGKNIEGRISKGRKEDDDYHATQKSRHQPTLKLMLTKPGTTNHLTPNILPRSLDLALHYSLLYDRP
jgi:hypothetical protein